MTTPSALQTPVGTDARGLSCKATALTDLVTTWTRRHAMSVVVAGMLLWLWSMFFAFSAQQKRQLMDDRVNELGLMASAVGQNASGLLRAVETDLRELDTWLVTHPGADPLRDSRFLAIIDEMRHSRSGLTDMRLVSTTGQAYWVPALDGKPRAEVADREYFRFHSVGPGSLARTMHVNAPVESRVDKRWYLPISMRLTPQVVSTEASGRDASPPMLMLYATIDLEQLASEHDTMRFKPDGTISLVREDGILLSRAPLKPEFIGRDLSSSNHYSTHYGNNDRGSFVSNGEMTDGVARLVAFERLHDYPVSVLVARNFDDVFAMYYTRMFTALLLNGLLTVAVIAITAVSVRARRAQQAMYLAQVDLHRQATVDELTGMLNRRAFTTAAHAEFQRARRYSRPTAVMMLDIDHFKLVNDDYGHADGDLVLRGCAARWQAALRDQDLLGRLGGEEFCVLLPETGPVQAALIAERLRVLTGASAPPGCRCMVTISVGWTVLDSDDETWSQVLARADKALYAAKKGGRNCVVSSIAEATVPRSEDQVEAVKEEVEP